MGDTPIKRPTPITVVAILWLLLGIYNLYVGFQGISSDVGAWDLLSDPYVHDWFKMVVPIELVLNSVVVITAVFQLIAVPSLLSGKSWSYPLALVVPLIIAVINLIFGALYATAPSEISVLLGTEVTQVIGIGVIQMIMLFAFWNYLNKPEVQAFLGRTQTTIKPQTSSPRKKDATSVKENSKEIFKDQKKDSFYCRYCGEENKSDAVFCETCGKKLK